MLIYIFIQIFKVAVVIIGNKQHFKQLGILHEILQDLIFKSPEAVDRLILIYQNLINTILNSNRTDSIVESLRHKISPYFTYKYVSWGGKGNGGLIDSIAQGDMLSHVKLFLQKKTRICYSIFI
ncbi:MAG: hypothetical protein LC105_07455 [Chitinophagales bacterium]|nr:hypothetical protein [Chitinophagales bacterium]